MDGDLVLIFTFVLTIVLIVTLGVVSLVNRNLSHREKLAEARNQSGGINKDAYAKLEERVRVLERIATDGNHALASQIENLRDLQELDAIKDKQEVAR